MAKKLAVDSFSDITFPAFGLDVSQGFDSQRPNTTNLGKNVRLYEPTTMRARGAARPGLLKYIPAQVPSGSTLIQMLEPIVSVPGTPSAIVPPGFTLPDPQTLDVPFPGGIFDPSDAGPVAWWSPFQPSRIPPGRTVPPGGSGIIRYKNPKKSKKGAITYLQSAVEQYAEAIDGGPPGIYVCTFPRPVQLGTLLVVVVAKFGGNRPTVTDSLGNTYSLAVVNNHVSGNILVFYCINAFFGSNTVTVHNTSFLSHTVGILEYQNVKATSPVDVTLAILPGVTSPQTSGLLTPNFNAELLLAAFGAFDVTVTSATLEAPFTTRISEDATAGTNSLYVGDHVQAAGHADTEECLADYTAIGPGFALNPIMVSFIDP